ncbi:hypothetical protein [Streptomyces sp. enrichment culture]|uniref:hypothetical protein n=1 Tax=Streptomyces sp. enrichment culture TaxID=1795815 RepID=UPI003F550050
MTGSGVFGRPGGLRARGCATAAAALLALAGCAADGTPDARGGPEESPRPSAASGGATAGAPAPSGRPSPSGDPGGGAPAPSAVPAFDPAKQPADAAAARALLDRVLVDQEAFGPDVRRSSPFESRSGHWPVLDADCVWQTAGLPPGVLATRTRYFHVPAGDGRGRVRISATVTVHRDPSGSGWETAQAMEEVLRCPQQVLGAGERLQNLWGASLYLGEQLNGWTEDAFSESGEYVGEKDGGPHPYVWSQGQFGPVTMAVAGRGAAGVTAQAVRALVVQGTSRMMLQAHGALAKEG